jgi:outer membrane protein TolC
MKMTLIFKGLLVFWWCTAGVAEVLRPAQILLEVFMQNPELAASKARWDSNLAVATSWSALANPKIGYMREANMTEEQRLMGPMESWSFSQEIMFPTKYFTMSSMQEAKAEASRQEYFDKKLALRQQALTQFYKFYAMTRISGLLEAQRETVRELARIAESRRATGAVPQQDEMKAHVEQTSIESEILLQAQEVVEMEASLKALLNRDPDTKIDLPSEDLKVPILTKALGQIEQNSTKNSKMFAAQQAMVVEAQTALSLAKQSYLPDFMLSYRRPLGVGATANSYAIGVEMTIPLWFFTRQMSEVSAASAKGSEEEKRLEQTKRLVEAESRSLVRKVETLGKLLKIYETTLMPQSMSALNSSRSAYSAGRVGFQELLDSERSLYAVRIEYYEKLSDFVAALVSLERTVGVSLSDLPMDEAALTLEQEGAKK